MTKVAPSTAASRYYLARMAAAGKNERLSSREGASEETGIDRKRMQRIEIGTLNPYPEEVLLMADTYHAPDFEESLTLRVFLYLESNAEIYMFCLAYRFGCHVHKCYGCHW